MVALNARSQLQRAVNCDDRPNATSFAMAIAAEATSE